MDKYPFIFSNEPKYRIGRHLVFWGSFWAFTGFIYSFASFPHPETYSRALLRSCIEAAIYLPIHIVLSYALMYFAIPRFLLKGKYWLSLAAALVIVIFSAFLSILITELVIVPLRLYQVGLPSAPKGLSIHLGFMAGLRGSITIGGIACAIKLTKYYYVKEQRNMQLQKENIDAQLQLLKAQVHPHFLFNTLNNIYSYTQKTSATASNMVMGLADLLRYILHEGNREAVPLSSELNMIDDYMMLEQVRYGNRLEINKELPTETNDLQIAPLLLLPFIENCFKHGTSQMLEQAWIRLQVEVEGNKLKMTVMNAKLPVKKAMPVSGIGIANARKRMGLLYPGKHELIITEDEDVFVVTLHLELEKSRTILSYKEPAQLMHA